MDQNAIIAYKNITAKISPCKEGYECNATDTLGNDLNWFIRANTIAEAITKAECHLKSAIRYFRGFIILSEFFKKVEET